MLIKNRSTTWQRSDHGCPVTAVPVITSVTTLGSTFIPFLWAVVISAHHLLRRTSGAGQ
jgi:hypothetical protein